MKKKKKKKGKASTEKANGEAGKTNGLVEGINGIHLDGGKHAEEDDGDREDEAEGDTSTGNSCTHDLTYLSALQNCKSVSSLCTLCQEVG